MEGQRLGDDQEEDGYRSPVTADVSTRGRQLSAGQPVPAGAAADASDGRHRQHAGLDAATHDTPLTPRLPDGLRLSYLPCPRPPCPHYFLFVWQLEQHVARMHGSGMVEAACGISVSRETAGAGGVLPESAGGSSNSSRRRASPRRRMASGSPPPLPQSTQPNNTPACMPSV